MARFPFHSRFNKMEATTNPQQQSSLDNQNRVAPDKIMPHPLDNVVDPSPHNGTVLAILTGMFELGRNRALQSGTVESRADDLRTLEDHARAMARDTYRDRFDPSLNPHDKMRQTEYQRTLKQREEAEIASRHAVANLRDAQVQLAKTRKAGERPRANGWLVAAFIVAIMISLSPTLHDFVFHTFSDDLLAWFGALVTSAFVACMLTLAILTGRRTTWEWIGVGAGIVLGLGLGILRLSSAEGGDEVMFSVGLTIFEIAVVLLLEWLASGLRHDDEIWAARRDSENEALELCDAKQADLSRCESLLQECEEQLARTILYVEDRHNRNIHLPELEALVVKSVLDGYDSGVTENIGRVRGSSRRAV